MKIFYIVFASFLFGGGFAHAQVVVPNVGSTWVSTLEYNSFSQDDTSAVWRRDEAIVVDRLEEGRPVFRGKVFGYTGEIVESSFGTVVYTDACKGQVLKEYLVPPLSANQCVWGVCNPPAQNETFTRKMVLFAELTSCQPKTGTYTFTTKALGKVGEAAVVIGDAKVSFGFLQSTEWVSYISPGKGEIYAESSSRKTTYHKVDVTLTTYTPPLRLSNVELQKTESAVIDKPEPCEIVAFGDSITEGLGAAREESYPARLSAKIGITVCNLGMSGNTTEDALKRIPEVLLRTPRIAIVSFGANDLFKGISFNATVSNLQKIVEILQGEKIKVIFLGYEGITSNYSTMLSSMVFSLSEKFKNKEGMVYLPTAFRGVLDNKETISSDGMHPNAAGYNNLAENISNDAFIVLKKDD